MSEEHTCPGCEEKFTGVHMCGEDGGRNPYIPVEYIKNYE